MSEPKLDPSLLSGLSEEVRDRLNKYNLDGTPTGKEPRQIHNGPGSVSPAEAIRYQSQSRLTIIANIYHQSPGGQPVYTTIKNGTWLESEEQPYVRKVKIGEDWQKLDLGWVDKPCYVVIVNEEGNNLQAKPSKEEMEEIETRVLYIGSSHQLNWQIKPGKCFIASPATDSEGFPQPIFIRSAKGKIRTTLYIYPG